ncbi:sulfurtransferase [Alkalihalobacterium chitinilyticum]|uniref:Sulfurtransferase n=1 Tax=Alkalihalobacterium chitinilyticum TaxID=2980103 RepID=A0ABT5V9U4_9BACI|nr:sulfurtransferase [Alkalihalobacterium chitinilyticum]MDE5411871.1 sulfurtransferase [Alkalihalobacterium chitinilyticum]
MKHVVEMEWLSRHLEDPNVRIVDCRFQLGAPEEGFKAYLKDHIPGSFYFDLEKDLSSEVKEHGGRHPLPDVEELAGKLSAAGIDEHVTVIAYDDQGGPFASRMWWLLNYLGHSKAFVLNGTYSQWKEKGYHVTDKIPQLSIRNFEANIQSAFLIERSELMNKVRTKNQDYILLDSREEKRYLGIEEPVDKIAGHIPTARHFFWKDSLTANQKWKPVEEQSMRLGGLDKDKEIIVYCGSGVTACPNVLTLKEADFTNVRLYVGSWSDWITYEDYLVEAGR